MIELALHMIQGIAMLSFLYIMWDINRRLNLLAEYVVESNGEKIENELLRK